MNVGKLFRQESERREASALISKATAPRPWSAMLTTWEALLGELCNVLGQPTRAREADVSRLHLETWRWMWSLPPASEARSPAFTLGAAALLIERWRDASDRVGDDLASAHLAAIGQRAESLLRIAAWHIDDARGEQHARTLGHGPTIPPHERVYQAGPPLIVDRGGVTFARYVVGDAPDRAARAILEDHGGHTHIEQRRLWSAEHMFTELCIASLPDGPWVMTTRDVERFIELILENT